VKPALRWSLATTLALSAWALWSPAKPLPVVAPVAERPHDSAVAGAADGEPLPASLERQALEPARRDPFGAMVQAMQQPAAPKAFMLVGPEQPPPLPPPPPLNYRFLGQMQTPDGQRLVYLSKGQDVTPVEVGTRLDEGYVVEAVSADAVSLRHPGHDAKAVIPITRAESR
jgi:hypothetical protein